MKTFFLLFVLCLTTYGYTQTTREEVVERFEDGSKKKVITYSGVGNAEKIIKATTYDNLGDLNLTAGLRIDTDNLLGTFLTPKLWVNTLGLTLV